MNKITKEQAEKLHRAIDLARKPGGCEYVDIDGACCVAGQIAAIEGVTEAELRSWGSCIVSRLQDMGSLAPDAKGYEKLESYPISLIRGLQERWDCSNTTTEAKVRMAMHDLVDGLLCNNV